MSGFKKNLLNWCSNLIKDVHPIKNFHKDFKDGLAFCAICYAFDPKSIDFKSLKAEKAADNLKLAFDTAEKKFKVCQLLDVEDITDFAKPDEIIVMTYISMLYKYFMKNKKKISAKQIKKASGSDAETLQKMKGVVKKRNGVLESRAKKNWDFLKKQVFKKIEVDFDEIFSMLEQEK